MDGGDYCTRGGKLEMKSGAHPNAFFYSRLKMAISVCVCVCVCVNSTCREFRESVGAMNVVHRDRKCNINIDLSDTKRNKYLQVIKQSLAKKYIYWLASRQVYSAGASELNVRKTMKVIKIN